MIREGLRSPDGAEALSFGPRFGAIRAHPQNSTTARTAGTTSCHNVRATSRITSTALAGITLVQLAIIACMALFASIVGGVSGYGTGALMPLVLVPILGPNPSYRSLRRRLCSTYRTGNGIFVPPSIDARVDRAAIALPTVMLGAWGYTQLSGRGPPC